MQLRHSINYRDVGVLDNSELGLNALLKWVRSTEAFRTDKIGQSALDVGFFASVIDIGQGRGLALCTDGVGTKVLIAEMLDRYDTIGIDCMAMNVNDLICVGAEPVSFVDYIAIADATPAKLDQIGKGLYEGARQAGVNIVGGEISQIGEIVRGDRPGTGIDIVGMCVGFVSLNEMNVGRDVQPGDAILGIRSSGLHSNGYTLARKALFERAGYRPDMKFPKCDQTIGEELLTPTYIYVQPIVELLKKELPIRALVNITSDGFLNLRRIAAKVGFMIDALPDPQYIFDLIQESGNISDEEMYRVFNMGIGFCIIVPDSEDVISTVSNTVTSSGFEIFKIGQVIEDSKNRVFIPQKNLVSEGNHFTRDENRT